MTQPDAFLFQQKCPGPQLAPFVRRLWYARGQISYRRDHILPNGSAVLLINLGAPHKTTTAKKLHTSQVQKDAWLCGVQSGALVNEPPGETHVVGASFATAGAAAFFGLPMSEVANRVIALDCLWGPQARGLREEILNAISPEDKLASLERGLLSHLLPTPRGLPRLEAALRRLLVPGPSGIASLAREVDLSPKQLIAEFHRLVGVTPGTLSRIARLSRLLEEIDTRRQVRWAELAAGLGWSDQAHLIRDFKNFSGATPTEYLRRRKEIFGAELEPGEDAIFLPSK